MEDGGTWPAWQGWEWETEGLAALSHSPAEDTSPCAHQNLPWEPKPLPKMMQPIFRSGFTDGDTFFVVRHV